VASRTARRPSRTLDLLNRHLCDGYIRLKERTDYAQAHLRLVAHGERKIEVIKVLRTFYERDRQTRLSLADAKGIVENEGMLLPNRRPGSQAEALVLSPASCEGLRFRLEHAGATVSVEPCES